jgi:deoxyribodipyrimidine photo-lyase
MRYFTQKLIDCDWANNVGNWQWVAGVEKWSNDYYKVFSMESQVSRFDPDCIYIKQWVPELKQVDPKDIIHWDTNYTKYSIDNYPEPIIKNLKESRKIGIEMYKEVLR